MFERSFSCWILAVFPYISEKWPKLREKKKNSKPNNVNNRRNKQIDQLTRIIRSESEHEKLIFRNFTFLWHEINHNQSRTRWPVNYFYDICSNNSNSTVFLCKQTATFRCSKIKKTIFWLIWVDGWVLSPASGK